MRPLVACRFLGEPLGELTAPAACPEKILWAKKYGKPIPTIETSLAACELFGRCAPLYLAGKVQREAWADPVATCFGCRRFEAQASSPTSIIPAQPGSGTAIAGSV